MHLYVWDCTDRCAITHMARRSFESDEFDEKGRKSAHLSTHLSRHKPGRDRKHSACSWFNGKQNNRKTCI